MKNYLLVLVLFAVLLAAGCTAATKEKKEAEKNETAQNNTSVVKEGSKVEQNATPAPVVEKSSEQKIVDYLKANAPSTFPSFENRIIEVEFEKNKSVLRFRTSTANPAQESLYLLGIQFIVFPDTAIANATGYNAEGKIIMSPDSRTQDTRTRYWRKYHAKTDWFPNLNLPPECKVDADCNDNDACTKDQCLKDGFCSSVVIVSSECPGI